MHISQRHICLRRRLPQHYNFRCLMIPALNLTKVVLSPHCVRDLSIFGSVNRFGYTIWWSNRVVWWQMIWFQKVEVETLFYIHGYISSPRLIKCTPYDYPNHRWHVAAHPCGPLRRACHLYQPTTYRSIQTKSSEVFFLKSLLKPQAVGTRSFSSVKGSKIHSSKFSL